MTNRMLCTAIVTLVLGATNTCFATNVDSLLAIKAKIEKPYIILDIPSSDCINCRAGASAIIRRLGKSVDAYKVIIVSDEKGMQRYFSEYKDIYGGYRILIDRPISDQLMDGGRSKMYFVTKDSTYSYAITHTDESTYNQILTGMALQTAISKAIGYPDSVFQQYGNLFTVYHNQAALYSGKYITGCVASTDRHTISYYEPDIDSATYARVSGIIGRKYSDTLYGYAAAKKLLHSITLPIVAINSYRIEGDTCYTMFCIKTCTEKKINDTSITVTVPTRTFIGCYNLRAHPDLSGIFSIKNYTDIYLLDTVHRGGKEYYPYIFKGFSVAKGNFYLTLRDMQDSSGQSIERGDFTIGEISFDGRTNQLPVTRLLTMPGVKRPDDLFFKTGKDGAQTVVDAGKKEFLFFQPVKKLPFTALHLHNGDTLTYVYDFIRTEDKIYFYGVVNYNRVIAVTLKLADNSTTYKYLQFSGLPSNILLTGNSEAVYL